MVAEGFVVKINEDRHDDATTATQDNVNKESFDFRNKGQSQEEDPSSKLVRKFQHKQKASSEISLGMDLEMEEFQHDANDEKLSLVNH